MALNFHILGIPSKLTAADMGVPDITKSLAAGIKNAYLPQSQAAALLKAQLENQFQKPRAARAGEFAEAELAEMQAKPYLTTSQARQAAAQASQLEWMINEAKRIRAEQLERQGGGQQGRSTQYVSPNSVNNQQSSGVDNTGTNDSPGRIPVYNGGNLKVTDPYTGMGRPEDAVWNGQVDDEQQNNQTPKSAILSNFNPKNQLSDHNWGLSIPGGMSAMPGGANFQSPLDQGAVTNYYSQSNVEKEQGDRDATQAQHDINTTNQAMNDVNKLWKEGEKLSVFEKGPEWKYAPPVTSEQKKYNADLYQMASYVAKQQSGTQSPTDQAATNALFSKPPLDWTDKDRSDAFNYMIGGIKRENEIAQLNNLLIAGKVPKRIRELTIAQFNTHRPWFNAGTLGRNTNYEGTYRDFATDEAVDSIARTGEFIPKNQKKLESKTLSEKVLKERADYIREHNPKSPLRKVENLKKHYRDQGIL